jgi:hypothetical protein
VTHYPGFYFGNATLVSRFRNQKTAIERSGGHQPAHLQWILTGSIQEGEGVVSGDQLAVTWHSLEGERGTTATGTARYTIKEDGSFAGTRSVDGLDGFGTEQVFPEP